VVSEVKRVSVVISMSVLKYVCVVICMSVLKCVCVCGNMYECGKMCV